ncbi:MAG TPA: monovalent cation/H+ antiporter complex subunit F [Gaiellaceae bacterium]|nr:monovalent cation/H+ antiporter complex subunit F [Gaiellaceae bacterium]
MNGWLVAATILLASLAPLVWIVLRDSALEGLVALELAGVVVTMVLLLLAQGFGRTIYVDLALVLAPLQFVGGLVFVRMLERGP